MKKSKAASLLLSLSLFVSAAVPGAWALPVKAENDPDNGMVISKTATANGDGSYTIQLEAYATGNKVITEEKKDIPADIILVLDQSGSMNEDMETVNNYKKYSNKKNTYFYDRRFNGGDNNLYYPVNGGYVEVQVDKNQVLDYTTFSSSTKNITYFNAGESGTLYSKSSNGEYQKVSVDHSWEGTYTYNINGQTIISWGFNSVPDFGSLGPLYKQTKANEYIYYYQLAGQDRVVIETSKGDDGKPQNTYYQVSGTTTKTTRQAALKTAATNFANSIAAKAAGQDGELGTDDDVDHRVAVVGFASGSSNDYDYENTELLSIAGNNSGSVGISYKNISNQNLKDVLQRMKTSSGQSMVNNGINALAAKGATCADLGMDMANRILNANQVPDGETRSRVVVFFTDGSPTSHNGFEDSVANSAINNAKAIKANGAVVYSIGVFPGADATANGVASTNSNRRENQFMQSVSSNNGTPKDPSYYLSAADAATLNSIFQQISNQIESGGSNATLSSETVIKDIISPQFTLPEGANANSITLETYSYIGENQWKKNTDSMGAFASVEGDTVDVTGFDYAANYVGTVNDNGTISYHGNKLVISFTVKPKTGFLGGNNIETNTDAGVYVNSDAKTPIMTFERPKVNVPIPDVTVTAEDQNVYLLGTLTADQLRNGISIKVGDVALDLAPTKENYGLEDWQTKGVTIDVQIKDASGNAIETDLSELDKDTTYTVTATVTPKVTSTADDAASEKTGTTTAKVNVYKPELTFKDSNVFYGETVPTDFSANLDSTKWKHDGTNADTEKMGAAPVLNLAYTPDSSKTTGGVISTKQDAPVSATVYIKDNIVTDYTTFLHTKCTEDCSWNVTAPNGAPAFLLHVKTCQLTIAKTGGAADEPYVFTVWKDGEKYSEITLVGNARETIYELPVGTYTIEEDNSWSWRYRGDTGNAITLDRNSDNGTITCTNTKNNASWLNGYSDIVTNKCN